MPRPTSTNRVWFSGWSSISVASTSRPYISAASALQIAARSVRFDFDDLGRRFGGRVRRPRSRPSAASSASQPAALRDRVRERHDRPHVGERDAGLGAEVERHRQVDLPLDQQLAVEGERVEGDRHRALDHVLDRHQAGVEVAALDRRDDVGNRAAAAVRSHAARSSWVSSASSVNVPGGTEVRDAIAPADRIRRPERPRRHCPIVVTSAASAFGASGRLTTRSSRRGASTTTRLDAQGGRHAGRSVHRNRGTPHHRGPRAHPARPARRRRRARRERRLPLRPLAQERLRRHHARHRPRPRGRGQGARGRRRGHQGQGRRPHHRLVHPGVRHLLVLPARLSRTCATTRWP